MTSSNDESADRAETPAPEPAIQCNSLGLRRGRSTTVLSDIQLALPPGAVVGLVGRNGAGKTSLIQCLLGLKVPTSGSSQLLGEDSLHLSDAVRDRLGYVAQTPDLFDWLSGEEHLKRFGTLYSGWSDRRAIELAARLDLNLGKTARNLSTGDQQKLSVVLALAVNDAPWTRRQP